MPFPTESLKVKQMLIAIKRRYGKPVVKREPATVEVVKALFQHFLPEARIEGCSLKNLRSGALYVLLFFSNARFKGVASLKISAVSISEEGNLQLIFRKAKNN